MKNRLLPGLAMLTIILLFTACSKKYVSPTLTTVVEPKITDEEGVFFTSLPMTYNKEGKYSQKAQDKGLQFVQVAVSNRTQDTVQLTTTHLQAFAEFQAVQLIPQHKVH